jgi:nicotinamidase-related amidase
VSGSHLAVVDMQKVFGDPAGDWWTPRFAEVVPPIRTLVDALSPQVTFTRFLAPDKPTGAWRRYYDRWPFAEQPADAEIYQLVDEFADGAGPTVDATTFGKWGPELAARMAGADRLVLAGVATDCCVLSTALAAADAGVVVWLVADACAGIDDAAHQRALDIARGYAPLIEVVDVVQVLAAR